MSMVFYAKGCIYSDRFTLIDSGYENQYVPRSKTWISPDRLMFIAFTGCVPPEDKLLKFYNSLEGKLDLSSIQNGFDEKDITNTNMMICYIDHVCIYNSVVCNEREFAKYHKSDLPDFLSLNHINTGSTHPLCLFLILHSNQDHLMTRLDYGDAFTIAADITSYISSTYDVFNVGEIFNKQGEKQ